VEAIILAGGKAERMGDATGGRPKSLAEVAERPLAAYQIARLAEAGVQRVIVSCAAGQSDLFTEQLADLGPEIVCAEEPERLGRGGGIKLAARKRQEQGDVFTMNGDELVAVDFHALLDKHRATGAAATVTVARPNSPFGIVELTDDDVITGFKEGGRIPYWVSCGVYVFSQEAIDRLPDLGDHETKTFPELAAEGRLRAYRHEGLWLTVNTPKELRRAQEHVRAHPEWLGA
jgi:NDP-sugar pyrophosphorylase family protein